MPCSWIAIRLTAFGALGSPSRSTITRPSAGPFPFGSRLFGLDQFAIARAMDVTGTHLPFAICAFRDRHDPPTFGPLAKHAQDTAWIGPDTSDQTGDILVIFTLHLL
jgi:hypothetical protein